MELTGQKIQLPHHIYGLDFSRAKTKEAGKVKIAKHFMGQAIEGIRRELLVV
jgi:hypothetical protein